MTDNQNIKALDNLHNRILGDKSFLAKVNHGELSALFHAKRILELKQAEIERLKTAYETLKQEYDSMFSANRNLMAEVERLQKIIVGFMDEVGTWSNKYDVDISNILKLPLLAKEDFNIKTKIKSEAIEEFAERLKKEAVVCGDGEIVFDFTIDNLVKEMTEQKE